MKVFTSMALILLGCACVPAEARESSSLKEAQKLWGAFRGCEQSSANNLAFDRCLSNVLHPRLTRLHRSKWAEFLALRYETTALEACPERQAKVLAAIGRSDFFCFRLKGERAEHIGYVAIEKHKSGWRLARLKFGP